MAKPVKAPRQTSLKAATIEELPSKLTTARVIWRDNADVVARIEQLIRRCCEFFSSKVFGIRYREDPRSMLAEWDTILAELKHA